MKKESWIVKKSDLRPAGDGEHCFYCGASVGEEHKKECVMREKTVTIRFSIDLVTLVPEDWDKNMIDFRYNESSWCANNLIDELKKVKKATGCLCPIVKAKVINMNTSGEASKFQGIDLNKLKKR